MTLPNGALPRVTFWLRSLEWIFISFEIKPKPFSEAFFRLVNKLDKDSTIKTKLQTSVSHKLKHKNAQYISRQTPTVYNKDYTHDQVGFIPGLKV